MRALLVADHPIQPKLEGALTPALALVEVANALVKEVRAGAMDVAVAHATLRDLMALPLELVPLQQVVAPALEAALRLGLSAYDGCYLALAEERAALLVTADRRLAERASRATLVT